MRRLKTLVGAGSFAHAANDPDPRTGPQRAAALARKAEDARITGLFTADLLQVDFIAVMNALFDANQPDAVQRGLSGAVRVDARKLGRIDERKGRLKVADMLGGDIDLSELPLDQPLPPHLLPSTQDVRRCRGRAEIFRSYALQGLTLRELIVRAEETGHWFFAGTPEQLADAIEERFRAGVLDVVSLHGLGQPDQEDLLLNGLLPELRRRALIDDDYVGTDFRSNLELPPLAPAFAHPGDAGVGRPSARTLDPVPG